MLYQHSTPIEEYRITHNTPIYVKREDLSIDCPGCPSAKLRGMDKVLQHIKDQGAKRVLYQTKNYSMAEAGLHYVADSIGGLEITITDMDRCLTDLEGPFWVVPKGLKHDAVVQATKEELFGVDKAYLEGTLVCCIGSGTIMEGIIKGLDERLLFTKVLGIGVDKYRSIPTWHRMSLLRWDGLGHEEDTTPAPFPCNSYYDRKAWSVLLKIAPVLKQPILFWNIGGNPVWKSK